MATFSERQGYEVPRASLGQFESMDERLRNALWNVLVTDYWSVATPAGQYGPYEWVAVLFRKIWAEQLGLPIDDLSSYWEQNRDSLRDWFFNSEWNRVYDLMEFILGVAPDEQEVLHLNDVLEHEGAAYRLVAGLITPITSAEEVAEVEAAARPPSKFEAAGTHIVTAGNMLSDRDNPDYRNSVKESISAVEAVVRVLTGKPKFTLGAGLKTLGLDSVHPALKKAWLEMYGWTSNESGIRHSLTTGADPGLAEARYMLVACSAFVNYLIAKSDTT